MKDKLEKANHKKAFYRCRTFGKAFAFAAVLALGSALPIVIVANASTETTAADPAATSSSAIDPDVGSELLESPLSSVAA